MDEEPLVPWPFPAILINHKDSAAPPLNDSPATYDEMVKDLGNSPW